MLLVERCFSFHENNFSSAGTILDTLVEFELPRDLVGSYWKKITWVSSNISRSWDSEAHLGAVLDFAKLRAFLANAAVRHGANLLLGHAFQTFARDRNRLQVHLVDRSDNSSVTCSTRLLVDASGFRRSVMRQAGRLPNDIVHAVGFEYLLRVPQANYVEDELIFLVGSQWITGGYCWIFPMGNNQLKIGAGQICDVRGNGAPALKTRADCVIRDYLKLRSYKVLDEHGGPLAFSRFQRDRLYADQIIAVGDSISAINPLGGEGIRHGMHTAKIAAEYAHRYLSGEIRQFNPYARRMRRYFSPRWSQCGAAAAVFYGLLNDAQMDEIIDATGHLSTRELMEILFHYRLSPRDQSDPTCTLRSAENHQDLHRCRESEWS